MTLLVESSRRYLNKQQMWVRLTRKWIREINIFNSFQVHQLHNNKTTSNVISETMQILLLVQKPHGCY